MFHKLSGNNSGGGCFERFLKTEIIGATLLFGAAINAPINAPAPSGGDDTAAIQAVLDQAQTAGGGTITFPAGQYNISSTLLVHTGTTLTGAPGDATMLTFNLSGSSYYGMTIDGGASNVTIQSLNMVSSAGLIGMYYSGPNSTGYTDIHITNNAFQFGGGSAPNGTLIFGIYGAVPNERLQITSNYFHDSPTSVRDWEIWYADNSNLDYNTLYKVVDGGHLCEPQSNDSFSYNYGEQLHRMGQEIQGSSGGTNLQVVGNTFYDWVKPYYDSFGLSVVNDQSHGTNVSNNYLDADIFSGSTWGIPDGGGINRFGYAIEAGGLSMTVDNNTIVGDWIAGIVASRQNVEASGDTKYGPAYWGDWIGEPSIDGYGSVDTGEGTPDSVDRNIGDAPTPPSLSSYPYNPQINGTPASQAPVIAPGNGAGGGLPGAGGSGSGSSGSGGSGSGGSPTAAPTWPTAPAGSSGSGGSGSNGGSGTISIGTTGAPVAQPATPQNTGTTTTGMTVNGIPVEIDPAADPTVPTNTLGTLTVTQLSTTSVGLTWTNPTLKGSPSAPTFVKTEVDIESTVGKQHFPSVLYSGGLVNAQVINLHPGWQIDFTVTLTASDGTIYRSGPVNSLMSGNSTVQTSIPLWGGISAANTPTGI